MREEEKRPDQALVLGENPTPHFSSLTWKDIDIPIPSAQADWQSRGDECKQLADEEKPIVHATRKEGLLAECFFDSSPTLQNATMLDLRKGPDEDLKVRFEALATKAGIALGCTKDWEPLKFWIFKLFLYLSKTKSHHLMTMTSHAKIGDSPQSDILKPHAGETVSGLGGFITNVYKASANFCFWLEKQALEAVEPNTKRGPTPIRDLEQLRKRGSLRQKQAAAELACSDRNIRAMVTSGRLTKSGKGRIIVDDRFCTEYDLMHSPLKK